MRKKITMLFASLLACVGVMKAAVTDLPEMSTEGDIKWYTIKNVRQGKFANYAGDDATMTQQAAASAASFFYFTASETEGAVKIHNYAAGEKLCAAYNSWTATGIDWYLAAQETGVSICTSTGEWNAWNDAGGNGQKVEYWSASDVGSAWEISLVTDFSAIIDVDAAKEAAKTELNNLASVSVLYPAATTAVAAVEAVEAASTGLADLNAAIEEINAIVAKYKDDAYKALEGKFFTINAPARGNGYMEMTSSKVVGVASVSSPADYWQFVYNNGKLNVYNPYTEKYLCEPGNASAVVAVTTDQAGAGAYDLVYNVNNEVADAKIKLTSNGKSVHMDGSSNLVRWDNGGASQWTVTEVTDFSTVIGHYKAATIATLDEWATLSVVFDATLIASAKEAINAIGTTDWATFAAIDATLTDVTEAVADSKVFTFQTIATDSHREGVWVAANTETEKAIGAHTENAEYNAIWSLRHAGGTSFYMYNVLNSVYMGAPSANCPLTVDPIATYSFEIVDAAQNIVEMKCNGETMHASNHTDDKLLNWDGDEGASRWTITSVNIVSDVHDVLISLEALQAAYDSKAYAIDAEVGTGLGQYQGDKEAIATAVAAGKAMLDKTLVEQVALNVADINAATAAINNAADLTINLPVEGKYYRFQGVCDAVKPNYYITGHTNADGGRIACTEEADASTIFYYTDGKLVAYQSGLYIGLNKDHWTFASVDDESKPASEITFAASPRTTGAYTIKSADRYLHYFYYTGDQQVQVNRCQNDTDAEHDWTITEVTTLPVTISEAGYATFYAPVEVTLPENVTAHTVTANGEWATLSEAISVVPAENGVILAGEAGTYEFAITTSGAADLENALAGTIAKTLVAKTEGDAYYVLAKKDENVGLYNPTKGEDTAAFYNAGHKAYWHIPATAQSAGYRFGEGTTSIEQVAADAELVIYDLAGRRVEKMEKGIYIVNGKKVIK